MTDASQPQDPKSPACHTGSVPAQTDLAAAGAHPYDSEIGSGPIAAAEATAKQISTDERPRGRLGPRFNWRSPFLVAIVATLGVALTYFGVSLLAKAAHVFILIGLALFLAIGMEPAVSWLVRHRFRRLLAVVVVLVVIIAVVGGFLALAMPAIVEQANMLVHNAPKLLQEINDKNSFIGKLNAKFQLDRRLSSLVSGSGGGAVAGGLLSGVAAVFGVVADSLIVFVLTIYFLANLPRVRALIYRLFPHRRRPRAILIGDEIMAKVGSYVLGNLLVSLVAGALTFGWLLIFHVPYALFLAIMVAILDLLPVVGSTIAGIIVALVALSVSLPVALATVAFFITYRLAEDYLLMPRLIGRAVDVPALLTVIAVLVGAAILGIIGALVAIPISAALLLLAREILFPRLDANQPASTTA